MSPMGALAGGQRGANGATNWQRRSLASLGTTLRSFGILAPCSCDVWHELHRVLITSSSAARQALAIVVRITSAVKLRAMHSKTLS